MLLISSIHTLVRSSISVCGIIFSNIFGIILLITHLPLERYRVICCFSLHYSLHYTALKTFFFKKINQLGDGGQSHLKFKTE